jgi:DNA-binding beta-propeller fold protein YncE
MDNSGNLYVTNFNGGNVSKVTSTGLVTTFATVDTNPVYIHRDATTGNFYVANYGSDSVSKITSTGLTTVTFASV